MNTRSSWALCSLVIFGLAACQSDPNSPSAEPETPTPLFGQSPVKPKRKPLFQFGDDSSDARSTTEPSRLLTGSRAEAYLSRNVSQPLRIGGAIEPASQLVELPSDPRELVKKIEQAAAHERAAVIRKLYENPAKVASAIHARREELAVLDESLWRLEALLNSAKDGETERAENDGGKKEGKIAARVSLPPLSEKSSDLTLNTKMKASDFIEARLQKAIDRFLMGDYLGSQLLADALLNLGIDSERASRARRLRKVTREYLARETVLYTELLAPDFVIQGRELRVQLRLTNRSAEPIVIIPAFESEGIIGTLEVSYESLFATGTRLRNQDQKGLREKQPIRLKPQEQYTLETVLPPLGESARDKLGRYLVRGTLRPFSLERGDHAIPYAIPIFERRVYVIPPRDLAATRDPLGSFKDRIDDLDDALAFLSEERRKERFKPDSLPTLDVLLEQIYTAVVLAGEWQREATLKDLEGILRKSPNELTPTLCAALATICGDPFQYDRETWLKWFEEGGDRTLRSPTR
jgi:hypothetical protein